MLIASKGHKMKSFFSFLMLSFFAVSCASYNYAENVKTVSFSDDVSKGKPVGPISGEDCTWAVFGQKLGGEPTIDKAFTNTKNQAGALDSAGLSMSKTENKEGIRYVNNVNTSRSGFNAYLISKECLVVKGMGYR
jgi:hypothetical protein